ncbi:hypothetical protein [Algicola sagamiensis]|uniref:hypothetical protein n=1 Tax=Algicola sagamiensis TaxID=163869 RepID=UPI000365F9F6|nr:hypothetical protein [Algicola sagamiensis]
MEEIEKSLFTFGNMNVIIQGGLFFLILNWRHQSRSLLITSGIVFAATVMMQLASYHLIELATHYKKVSIFLWYITLSFINMSATYCLYQLHLVSQTQVSGTTCFIAVIYLVFTIMQVARLCDRVIFKTNILPEIYQYSVFVLDLCVTFCLLYSVFYVFAAKPLQKYLKGFNPC